MNIKASEIPVGDRSPDATTQKDLWKFAVSWHCSQKTFCGLYYGEGHELPVIHSITSITQFKF